MGQPVEHPDFSLAQVEALADRHRVDWKTQGNERRMTQVGGHPYLVRVALHHLTQHGLT